MKNQFPWDADDVASLLFVLMFGVVVIAAPAFSIYKYHMESATFNRLTGAHTTWWDAVWVELRVQEAPNVPR
jgi:hypothetical protein